MADYIYLLENRLSAAQQKALQAVREVARTQGLTVFLVGGAVRDLTSGSPVRDLDVVVQGNALLLRAEMEAAGATIAGEMKTTQSLFARFEGGVRVEIGSTLSASYPKLGRPEMEPATILDDLRRRDFTVNAMALSLNEGSYGLLMDPLNGVADIENRQLRLVSNYGFIEDPVRMIRAARFSARLGWTMDEKTQARYDTGKEENYIQVLSPVLRGYETEEIFHEEEPLRILRKLEEEGWMKHLFPALTVAKANVAELEKLREIQTQLQMRGIHPDAAAANFPLMTAKLSAQEVADLKRGFVRQGFVAEVEALESAAKEVATQLAGKNAALPSQAWKLLQTAKPEAVLWMAYSSKSSAVQAKLKSFHTEWPKARQKVPYALMQEMRIVPELEGFNDIVEKLFYELMDGNLGTVEEMKAFLEVYSPPAPPPPVNLRRARAGKKDAKGARGRKKASDADDDPDAEPVADLDDDEDASAAKLDAEEDSHGDEEESEEEATEVQPLRSSARREAPPVAEPPRLAPIAEEKEELPATPVATPAPPPVVRAPEPASPEPRPVAPEPAKEEKPAGSAAKQAAPVAAKKSAHPAKHVALAKAAEPVAAKPVAIKSAAAIPATKAVKATPVPMPAKASIPAKKTAPVKQAPTKPAPAKATAAKTPAVKAPAGKAVPAPAKTAAKIVAKGTPAAKKR